jgi:antirestriction protein ArdC
LAEEVSSVGAYSREPGRRGGQGQGRRAFRPKGCNAGRAGRAESGAAAKPRASLYDEVTQRIIAELEAGRLPWVQPWDASPAPLGLPRNAATGRSYSGINILILWGAVIERGYASQNWLTFRQARQAGGCVRRGERGVGIFYADRFTPESEKERARETGEDPREIPFLKRFTVFNVAQCDGLPDRMRAAVAPLPERETVAVAEALIAATGADFRIGGNQAFYSPADDFVQVPPQPAFRHQIDYYRTALHELGHWTGHSSRLARDLSGGFGSESYAREELCAELASAFLCAALSIQPTVRHADYIGSWLEVLRGDSHAIFRAASHASKAADFLLAFREEPAALERAA